MAMAADATRVSVTGQGGHPHHRPGASRPAGAPTTRAGTSQASRRGTASATPISASVRWAIANAAFAAGTPA